MDSSLQDLHTSFRRFCFIFPQTMRKTLVMARLIAIFQQKPKRKLYFYSRFNMKTTRANSQSFRLHHVGKANSTRKSSQTFYHPDDTFKLAALNSVTRGVKHADLSFMTGTNLNKLRVEPIEPNEGQYNSAHDNLTEVRLKFDELKKQRVGLEDKIDRLKEEIGKFSIFKQEYQDKIGEAKSKAEDLKNKLEEKKVLLEITATEKKVLLHMEWRHKTDKIFYDQKKFDCQQILNCKKKQLNIYKKEGHQFNQGEDRTNKVYEKLAAELEEERNEREMHIRNLQAMIDEKLQLQNVNHEREADLYQIAERAMQDKDYNEKQWRKILLTHIFVNKMLRNKIEKEMEKFRTVQFAFKQIKTATGVNDAKTLVTKYLNKQAVYGELLSKIADNEKSIQQLKNQTDELIHQSKQLQMQKEVLHSVKIKTQDLHDDIKELEIYDDRALVAEDYQNKMGLWVTRQLKKFSNDKKAEEQPSNTSTLITYMQRLLQFLTSEVETHGSLQVNLKDDGEGFGQRQNQKNTRVVPKRSRKNSMGEEIFDVDEEQLNPHLNVEQVEQINLQHQQILRQNEKFMRQLKRRKDEEKKLLLEKKESKPKEGPKVPEPKKEE